MPRAASWSIIAAAFVAGVFLPDLVAKAAVPEPKPVSAVAVEDAPGDGALQAGGLAPGVAMREEDGRLTPEEPDRITPLNVRDAAALVMAPGDAAPPPCAQKPCDCSQDSLHRYEPKKRKRKEFEALRGKKASPGPGAPPSGLPPMPPHRPLSPELELPEALAPGTPAPAAAD